MEPLRRNDLVDQAAMHLRNAWRDSQPGTKLPGLVRLAGQLGVSKATVRGAVGILEAEGLLVNSENG